MSTFSPFKKEKKKEINQQNQQNKTLHNLGILIPIIQSHIKNNKYWLFIYGSVMYMHKHGNHLNCRN